MGGWRGRECTGTGATVFGRKLGYNALGHTELNYTFGARGAGLFWSTKNHHVAVERTGVVVVNYAIASAAGLAYVTDTRIVR